jgi:hypothetical protein
MVEDGLQLSLSDAALADTRPHGADFVAAMVADFEQHGPATVGN